MANVASWIRECDESYFQRFFDTRPDITLCNARVEKVDLECMDGLLLTGGEDISAEFHIQPIEAGLIQDPQPRRDEWEFAALPGMLQAGKPVLAVCKGHQVLNVVLGGTLHLDIPGHNKPEMKHGNIQPMRYSTGVRHRFDLVNSSHHQAVDRLGEGLEVEGWCASDDVIEQMRLRNYPFGIGVQYHPERDWLYESLFRDFFDHIQKQ